VPVTDDLVAAAAANLAGWHESSLRALGIASRREAGVWVSEKSGPVIFHSAITLTRSEPDAQIVVLDRLGADRTAFSVCDSWAALELGSRGFRRDSEHGMRRGFGEALTRRAIACAPGAPAVLQPSSEGYATYRGLGFAEIGGFTNWIFETPEA
jgi:hypothetical protein